MLRRLFLSRFAGAPVLFGLGGQATAAPAAPARTSPFEAERHTLDDWMDQVPGRHRVVFDTWTAAEFQNAVQFAGNIFRGNKDGYSLSDKDVAMIITVRHHTAPFAFTDALWAKYGVHFSKRMSFVDPATKQAPTANLYGRQVSNLIQQGVHMAVCNLTTRAYTRIIADATGKPDEEIYKELTTGTLGNSHFVPAGVVAVTRAQEHGYTLVSVG